MIASRLLAVAQALRESPNPELFNMDTHTNDDGQPTDPLAHYCAREDLQRSFALRGDQLVYVRDDEDEYISYQSPAVLEHFDIDLDEAEILFGGVDEEWDDDKEDWVASKLGCAGCTTAEEAANFIEKWVLERSS